MMTDPTTREDESARLLRIALRFERVAQDALKRERALLDLLQKLALAFQSDDRRALARLIDRAQHILSQKIEPPSA